MNWRQLSILLNYAPARQHSLNLYGDLLCQAANGVFGEAFDAWRPNGIFSRMVQRRPRQRLWADMDKYLVAPIEAALRSNVDVLHIADNSNGWYGLLAKKTKLVITCHDMIPWLCASGDLQGWQPSHAAKLILRLNMTALFRANHIISVSHTSKTDLIKAGIDEEKISVIPNCVIPDLRSKPPVKLPQLRNPGRTFFHLGAGKFPKNTDVVLDAFGQLPQELGAELVLVGPHASEFAAQSSASAAIHAWATLSTGQIRFLYENACALVMPSRYEGFGLPILEAGELGCPAISSNGGALSEVAPDGPLKLSSPVDAAALALVLAKLLTDHSFRADEVKRGRDNAGRYSRAQTLLDYSNLYSDLCRA